MSAQGDGTKLEHDRVGSGEHDRVGSGKHDHVGSGEHDRVGPGGLLGRAAILGRIGDIFDVDTFSRESLRGAAYDLRLARDFLILSDGTAYGPRQKSAECGDRDLRLKPGDIAYVASCERLRLQWDLTACIVPKYSFVREGLLVLHGGLVDPGYGLEEVGRGRWRPRNEERLHFFLANIGGGDQALKLGEEKIAALQFFAVEPVPGPERREIVSAVRIWESYAQEPDRLIEAIAFFKKTTQEAHRLDRQAARLNGRLERLEHALERIDATNERVVAFGVYVMAAALLTGGIAALVAIFSTKHRLVRIQLEPGTLDLKGLALLVGAFALAGAVLLGLVALAGKISGQARRELDAHEAPE